MTIFVDYLRRFVDVSRFRHHLNRRRRLVAALLAGAGAFLLITALRSPAPVLDSGLGPRLDIAPDTDQILFGGTMVHPFDILFDDRPFVEIAGDEMRGRPDQLDAALMRLAIGPRALEAGQKAVMDIDAAPREPLRHSTCM